MTLLIGRGKSHLTTRLQLQLVQHLKQKQAANPITSSKLVMCKLCVLRLWRYDAMSL